MQELLNIQARLSNELYAVEQKIKQLRGDNPPVCFKQDDCSTAILATCPWRIDCGD
jgi:hypothetical protein